MNEEEKNKETDQKDLSNKENVIENDINTNDNTNNSEAFRHINREKIKINEEKLKDAKEQTMEIKSEITSGPSQNSIDIARKNNSLMQSTVNFVDNRHYYYLSINRCLTTGIKKIVLIILLVISICFVFISIFDLINSFKKILSFEEKIILMNNIIVFIIQTFYAFSLLFFQGLAIILDQKENLIFNIISILLISIIIILRTVLVVQNNNKNSTMIINFFCSLCLTLINLGIFLITLKILKMKRNVKENIEEIINFTDIQGTSSKISDRKDNQLMLNNSGIENKQENEKQNNKEGISNLVEETNDVSDSNPNIEQK